MGNKVKTNLFGKNWCKYMGWKIIHMIFGYAQLLGHEYKSNHTEYNIIYIYISKYIYTSR